MGGVTVFPHDLLETCDDDSRRPDGRVRRGDVELAGEIGMILSRKMTPALAGAQTEGGR